MAPKINLTIVDHNGDTLLIDKDSEWYLPEWQDDLTELRRLAIEEELREDSRREGKKSCQQLDQHRG